MEENTCFWNYLKEEWLLTDEWLYFDLGTVIDFYHLTLVIDSFNSLLNKTVLQAISCIHKSSFNCIY